MSFYASQFNKTSRYCSSNLYGSNLSTVYADGPPPLDDTLEEDDEEIVFRNKKPTKSSPEPKLDNANGGNVPGETQFSPWAERGSNQTDVADDEFGDFTAFADFSSAFGGSSKSQSEPSWFDNGNNDQSSVTNFNCNTSHQGGISASSSTGVDTTAGRSSKDDDFGCFSGGDDSDFDDFSSFTGSNQNTNTEESKEDSSNVSQVNENPESKKTAKSNEIFKNDSTIHDSNEHFNHAFSHDAKKSNFSSDDDFDEFCSSERESPTNELSTSTSIHQQNSVSRTHLDKKTTCFSDDDDDDDDEFGDFNSSSLDDDSKESAKSSDLITNSEKSNIRSQQESFQDNLKSDKVESSCKSVTESEQSTGKSVPLSNDNHSVKDLNKNEDSINTFTKEDNFTITDNVPQVVQDNDNNEFGFFSASASTEYETEEIMSKGLPDKGFDKVNHDDDDDFGEFGVVTPPNRENNRIHDQKEENNDFGDFGAAFPSKESSSHGNSDNAKFRGFGEVVPTLNEEKHENGDDNDEFGEFGAVVATKEPSCDDKNDDQCVEFGVPASSPKKKSKSNQDDDDKQKDDEDDDFGDFSSAPETTEPDLHCNNDDEFSNFGVATPQNKETAQHNSDGDFGDFGSAPETSKPKLHGNDNDDNFGDFGVNITVLPNTDNEKPQSNKDDDEFGDFRTVSSTNKSAPQTANDDDDDEFGDFGVAAASSEQNKEEDFDDFGDFAEVKEPKLKENEPKTSSMPPSLIQKTSLSKAKEDDDDDFGQFGSAPSKTSDGTSKSLDSASKGFADFSSVTQNSISSSFSTTSISQSFSNTDVKQEEAFKITGSTAIIKPQRNTNVERIINPFKQCFIDKDNTTVTSIMVQLIEHEVQCEKSTWQQLLTSERDGSLRFDWVLSEHQVKMLEGLSMAPVKIQTSVSFKPRGQAPIPLFASSMGLLEPVKGVITPFHHIEDINPSQDPFGAPPEVGVQDLGFDKGSKKETLLFHTTEIKDNISDTISVSSSLDLDFLAPSNSNGESTKTESRGLFEDDLLGLGMQFSEPSPSPKEGKDQKYIFKFNNTTIPLAANEGNLSEKAKNVTNDFEDLSFMLSKVLMFPLKSKE